MFSILLSFIVAHILYRIFVKRESIGLSKIKKRQVKRMYTAFFSFIFIGFVILSSLALSKKDINVSIQEISIEELVESLKKGDSKTNQDYVNYLEDISVTHSKIVVKTISYNDKQHSYLKVALRAKDLNRFINNKHIIFK